MMRRVDGVEVDAAIQDERAIKLATAYEGRGRNGVPASAGWLGG